MESAEDIRAHLTAKAAVDSAFRAQLVADPKGIMNQEFGITVPDNIDIVVVESDMRTVYLALPPDPLRPPTQPQSAAKRNQILAERRHSARRTGRVRRDRTANRDPPAR